MGIRCRALILAERGRAPELDEIDVSEPGPGEVLVRMVAAGLCHTDLAYVRDARIVPMVLGHEGVGVVERLGGDTQGPPSGAQVVLSWRAACGRCRRCRVGQRHLCESPLATSEPKLRWRGEWITPMSRTGCFSEYVVVPVDAAVEVPAALPPDRASLLGCAVPTGLGAALRTVEMHPWSTVAVWGSGAVGLNIVAGAKFAGAETIVAVDPDPERLGMATARGATVAVPPQQAADAIRLATEGRGVDFAFEASGRQEVMAEAYAGLAPAGELVVVSALPRDAVFNLSPREFGTSQQRIIGCVYGSIDPPRDLALFASWYLDGRLALDDLVSGHIPFLELPAAFRNPPKGIRNVVDFN